ncbi:YhcH/YjgK/YiaL family protein [Paenibacillus rigui]|uniref:YhcH/YjgK/YiaL family protein n=1 Tax=Paenibacillus rigui TaxID=554312 RepID=A0A229UKY4_9BACL|nr:YhcH/YjgK/YiaL family protein [Paenibacillus rigui]OXM84031.1 YhcH/YjgK/YiaL family protein [Paenibacillus rigui]
MIFGDMAHYEQEKATYSGHIRKGLEAIVSMGLAEKAAGKYEIDGELMFALVQELETEPAAKRRPESHEKYADIQLLVSGEEAIGVAKYSAELPVQEDMLGTRDIVFYERADNEFNLLLRPGQFAVFYPSDVHRPCCNVNGPSAVKKIVVKIHKQLWNA